MPPAVSVVIPAYNAEQFVAETLDSVLSQTFTDFELIVVDDGSSDGTRRVLDEYARRDPRMRVHAMPANAGAIAARNTGVSLSTGEFLAAMDADDVCLPHRLERQVEFLRANPEVGVVGAYVRLIDDKGTPGAVKTYPSNAALMAWSLLFYNCFAHPAVMMRRSVIEAANGYAAECKGGTEDFELFQRLSHMVRLSTIEEVLLHYRRWGGSMTGTLWTRQEEDATRIVREGINRTLGLEVATPLAAALRGLPAGRYPQSAEELNDVGRLIVTLFEAFSRQPWISAQGRKLVAKDAAVKLWLLAVLALRKEPRVAFELSRSATRLRPWSVIDFAVKAISRTASWWRPR